MVKRIGTARRGSRSKFSKSTQDRGKISIRSFFWDYKDGQNVVLKADTAVQKGLYPAKFHGKAGVICGKVGSCYKVRVMDHSRPKIFIVHPVHLKYLDQERKTAR